VLPTLARYAHGLTKPGSESDRQAYRLALGFGIRLVLLLMVPAAIGLALLREPLIRLLFEHNAFTHQDTVRTATVLMFYAFQLPFTALDQLLVYACYARRDTVTPVALGVLTLGVYLGVALATKDPLGINGLALASAAQNSVHGLLLLALLSRALGGFPGLFGFARRVLLATTGMGVAVALALNGLTPALNSSLSGQVVLLLVTISLGLGVYYLAVWILRVEEARALYRQLRGRLGQTLDSHGP
jgi:putative peptidoglycan lipid II flippase